MINGFSSVNLTKLDVLSTLKQIKIGVGYTYRDGRKYIGSYPSNLEELSEIVIKYEVLPGWESDISQITSYEKLPSNCKRYVERVEELLGLPVSWIGNGPARDSMIINPKI